MRLLRGTSCRRLSVLHRSELLGVCQPPLSPQRCSSFLGLCLGSSQSQPYSFSISLTRFSLLIFSHRLLPCHFNYARTEDPSFQHVAGPHFFNDCSLLLVRDDSESGFMIVRIEHGTRARYSLHTLF